MKESQGGENQSICKIDLIARLAKDLYALLSRFDRGAKVTRIQSCGRCAAQRLCAKERSIGRIGSIKSAAQPMLGFSRVRGKVPVPPQVRGQPERTARLRYFIGKSQRCP